MNSNENYYHSIEPVIHNTIDPLSSNLLPEKDLLEQVTKPAETQTLLIQKEKPIHNPKQTKGLIISSKANILSMPIFALGSSKYKELQNEFTYDAIKQRPIQELLKSVRKREVQINPLKSVVKYNARIRRDKRQSYHFLWRKGINETPNVDKTKKVSGVGEEERVRKVLELPPLKGTSKLHLTRWSLSQDFMKKSQESNITLRQLAQIYRLYPKT